MSKFDSMWAILVGIQQYPVESKVDPVNGALKDVDRMHDLLVHDMGVQENHVVMLKDQEATRAKLLQTFQYELSLVLCGYLT